MNLGTNQISRSGVILLAMLFAPAWATAQVPHAALTDWVQAEASGDGLEGGGLILADQLQLDPWSSNSQLQSPVLSNPVLFDPILTNSLLDDEAGEMPDESEFAANPPLQRISQNHDHTCQQCGAARPRRFTHSGASGNRVCETCGYDVQGRSGFGPGLAMRLGWWGVENDGSPVKVGEYQGLSSSPFWDLDGVWTNRSQTLDFTLSGLDNDTNAARGFFYGTHLTGRFEYDRFLHRLDHLPLAGFDINRGPPGPTDKVVTDDLNVGEDYAIRVQQLDASVKGQLTKDLRWRVNLWGMRKSGERQANAMAHCFNVNPPPAGANYTCHVLSQRQNIDWTTIEIEPHLEANLGDAVVEYSRTMRAFGQNDQAVERTYTDFGFSPAFGVEGEPFVYGWVPENFTQIDRLKLNVPLNDANEVYTNMYLGETENEFRGTRRNFNGVDLRLTNRAFDDVTLVGYTKLDTQRTGLPTNLLTSPPFGINAGPAQTFEPGSLRQPVNYSGGRVGFKGNWQSPSKNWLSFVGGYEYFDLSRAFAEYNTLSGPFTQQDTQTHQLHFGPYLRVSPTLDTYVRYKGGLTNNPLIGVRAADGEFNSNQPEQLHRIEFGGTWNPQANLVATALFGIENSWHHSQFANFDEDNYPILFTLWYAPTDRLSLTGGYAFLSNWIDQDITIGFLDNPTETTQWNYDGYNNVVNVAASYAYSARTQLVGSVEWNRGSNVFSVPPSIAGADWTALPSFSDVIVETTRINLGVDHQFRPSMNAYFRYVHFDFEDLSEDFNSGTTNMFLAGLTMLR